MLFMHLACTVKSSSQCTKHLEQSWIWIALDGIEWLHCRKNLNPLLVEIHQTPHINQIERIIRFLAGVSWRLNAISYYSNLTHLLFMHESCIYPTTYRFFLFSYGRQKIGNKCSITNCKWKRAINQLVLLSKIEVFQTARIVLTNTNLWYKPKWKKCSHKLQESLKFVLRWN